MNIRKTIKEDMYFGKDGLPMLKKLAKEFVKQLKARIDSDK